MAKPLQNLSPYRSPRNFEGAMRPGRGTGVISGTTKQYNIAGPCKVWLHSEDGTLMGFRRTGAAGTYTFRGLPPNYYFLVIADDSLAVRSKVEHVLIT